MVEFIFTEGEIAGCAGVLVLLVFSNLGDLEERNRCCDVRMVP